MNIGKSFSFVFEDKQWITKLGLGAVVTLIPILNFAWNGYLVALMRNVMKNDLEPLPNWDDFGKKFSDGLILTVATLVYSLPALVVFCLPLSFMVVPAILAGDSDMQGIADAIVGAGSLLFICLTCVFALYALFLSAVFPAVLVLFARESTFASCFKFGEVTRLIRNNVNSFLTAWGVSLGVNLGVGFVVSFVQVALSFIPCIGSIIAIVITLGLITYSTAVYAHLFGQFGESVSNNAVMEMSN